MATGKYGQFSISTSNFLVLGANTSRLSYIITNQGPSTVFLGPDTNLTTANGIAIGSGSNITEDSGGDRLYLGSIYAVSASQSNISYWERNKFTS